MKYNKLVKHIPITLLIIFVFSINSGYAQQFCDASLQLLEKQIAENEAKEVNLKPGNEARIIWDKDHKYMKSNIAFLYLHGFGASNREGEPIMDLLSQKFHANVYMSRLKEHGINRANAFEFINEQNYLQSAQKALQVAKQLGDTLIVVGTSTGGSFSLILASEDNDIDGLILYSPFIKLFNDSKHIVTNNFGKMLFYIINMGWIHKEYRSEEVAKYWSTQYHVNSYDALLNLVDHHMNDTCFSKVTCPVFMGYYYKNNTEQDQTASVPAMLQMFNKLGCTKNDKVSKAFPLTGNHVIGCDLRSNDWQAVYNSSIQFINTTILK